MGKTMHWLPIASVYRHINALQEIQENSHILTFSIFLYLFHLFPCHVSSSFHSFSQSGGNPVGANAVPVSYGYHTWRSFTGKAFNNYIGSKLPRNSTIKPIYTSKPKSLKRPVLRDILFPILVSFNICSWWSFTLREARGYNSGFIHHFIPWFSRKAKNEMAPVWMPASAVS